MTEKHVRTIIVDDEALARQMIREYLVEHPRVNIVAECGSGREAVRVINELRPDLIFLDIQMPELTGFEVLKKLDCVPHIIFSTAYDKYALQAFEVNAVDYLLKPYDRQRFNNALQRTFERMQADETAPQHLLSLLNSLQPGQAETSLLWVKDRDALVPIKVDAIDWVEAMDDYVCLHVGKTQHLVHQTMQEMASRLPGTQFMRIHRSSIVNLDRIRELRPLGDGRYRVVLKDGTELSLSRSQAKRLKEMVL